MSAQITCRELKEIMNKIPENQLDAPCFIVEPYYQDEFPLVQANFGTSTPNFYLFAECDEDD